ncbi:MAG TPA: alanine--glyoxylate aminotransferase family protein [Anaerolineaceae bacterium]|nr:alanine--glyoxylate aminotransferase family protein [Anaerolineaceae bacterium]HPN51654.1 alanine--glyoxylate aminotransferase family protein [Anaerolineaceae bacterium]
MTKHIKLFTPGPGDVDEDVLDALSAPVMRHYGPEWMEVYNETISLLREFYLTENDLFMVPGPGTATLDMAIGSTLASGEKIIVGNNGFFGDRLLHIAEAYGLNPVLFSAPLGQPLDPEALQEILKAHPDAKAVAMVHHETSTTVLNPLRQIADVTHAAGRVIIVDAVSSLGGIELPVDEWGIDICVTASNKCLEAVPGVGFISVSDAAWKLVDSHSGNGHGWYLNLRNWRKYLKEWGSWHPTPVTMPVNVIFGVCASMKRIRAKGLEAHREKYVRANQIVRKGMASLGFEMFVAPEYAAPIASGYRARPEFEIAEMMKWLLEERAITIGGGLGPLSGKIFRIGHLGKSAEREYLVDFLFAMEEFLRTKGIDVPVGAALIGM